jgi:hypothetical protein
VSISDGIISRRPTAVARTSSGKPSKTSAHIYTRWRLATGWKIRGLNPGGDEFVRTRTIWY